MLRRAASLFSQSFHMNLDRSAMFGQMYVDLAQRPLEPPLIATIPQGILALRVVLWRLDGFSKYILISRFCVLSALIAFLVAALPRWGLDGVAGSWLAAHIVVALCVLPSLAGRLFWGETRDQ